MGDEGCSKDSRCLMMMFAACAASMRWVMIGKGVIVGAATAGIAWMTAIGLTGVTSCGLNRMTIGRRCPESAGRPGHRRWRVPALRTEARPADGIHRRCSRMPAIGGRELVSVHAGGMVMVELLCCRLDMVLVRGRLFLWRGPGLNTRSTIETGPVIHGSIINHRIIDIGIVNHGSIDIHHSGIVTEVPPMPFPAYKSGSSITVAIVDAAIKADMRPPIAAVPAIAAAGIAPVARCP